MQQVIPLTPQPNQTIVATLNVDGAPLVLTLGLDYDEVAGYWLLTIADRNDQPILRNVPLVTGNFPACNVLGQWAYLGIGSAYVINVSGTKRSLPDNTDLGSDFQLIWGNTPAA